MKYLKTFESIWSIDDLRAIRGNFPLRTKIVSEIKNLLLRDCKKYLLDLKKVQQRTVEYRFLYRGVHVDIPEFGIEKLETFKNRTPQDLNINVHNYVNDFFEDKFGVRLRSDCAFTLSVDIGQGLYGRKYLFFPIGDYKAYTSEKVEDFYSDDLSYVYQFMKYVSSVLCEIHGSMKTLEITPKSLKDYTMEKLRLPEGIAIERAKTILEEKKEFDKLLDSYKEYDNVEYKMMTKPNEIMIKCDNYYIVSVDYIDDIKKIISNLVD